MNIIVTNSKGGSGKSTLVCSLAQVLEADIVDHDNQGTISITSSFTGINRPVDHDHVTKKNVVHDTPPYNSSSFKSLYQNADVILVPCNISYADLTAIANIVQDIRSIEAQKKCMIVYNRVRKPHNNSYRAIKEAFTSNYKDIRKAKTELSQLNGFLEVFAKELSGKALKETESLVREILGVIYCS